MEHLTKQQIVLLTLLVSFVTSIATGIVTVALMDQAPVGVTSTINHIIERTVETVATPADATQAAAAITTVVDSQTQISTAIATVQKSIVLIKNVNGMDAKGNLIGSTTGTGIVVSSSGLIVTDKAAIALIGTYIAQLPNGVSVPVQIIQSQNDGDLVLLSAQVPSGKAANTTFTPAVLANALPKLGQTILSFTGGDSPTIAQGLVTNVTQAANSTPATFTSSIDMSKLTSAAVLFNTLGQVNGFETASGILYPVAVIKSAVPQIQ